jgi:hypothetical protein
VYSTTLSKLASVARFSIHRDTIPDVYGAFNAAIEKVLTCYEEGQHDSGLRIRTVHISYVVCIISSEKTALRKAHV